MNSGVTNQEIEKNKDLLFTNILTAQQSFNGIKEGEPAKTKEMLQRLEDFNTYRGRNVVYDYLSSGRGHGPFTELMDGSVKYDLIGGIGVQLLGHSHPIAIKSYLEAATQDIIMCGNLQPYNASIDLAESLLQQVKESRLHHFWFAGSGSFANDLGLKLLWQKKAPAYRMLAFKNNFAGRSVATQEITDNENYREDMPQLIDVDCVPHYDHRDRENSIKNTLSALDKYWEKYPSQYAAIMMELVQGEGGLNYGIKKFYHEVCRWARSKGIYIWSDEVQTYGRTRELFAFQMFELDEYVDLVSVGKNLQCCGVLYTKDLNPRPGLIAGTFHASLPSLLMGAKSIKFLTEGGFYGEKGRIAHLEKQFLDHLQKLKSGSCKNIIGDIGGIGTMIGFEVGAANKQDTWKFLYNLFKNGVIGFSSGKGPVKVRFLLPVTLTDEHITEIFEVIEKTLQETFSA